MRYQSRRLNLAHSPFVSRRGILKTMPSATPVKPLPTEDLAHILTHSREAFASLQNARLFITGGTGFFGHWLLESLLHANRELSLNIHATVLTRSVASFQTKAPHITGDPAITLLEGDIKTFPFPTGQHTHIIHAATDTATQHAPAYELAESILEGTRRVLQFAQATGARHLLYTSSGAIYGRGITNVASIPETYPGAPNPLLLQSSYDEAKRMAEHLCVAYSHGTPLECSIARCFAFVGPHLPLDQHFAIGNFIRDAIANTPIHGGIHIKGDGTPLRSFLYMSDLAIWLWTMLASAPANRAYNVGSDESISIAGLAHLTADTLHPGLSIQIDGTPIPGAPPATYVPNITRAQNELGLKVTIPLAEAIRRTAAWHGFPAHRFVRPKE
jgi:nucleoside-diphosphate-sugar epimerase